MFLVFDKHPQSALHYNFFQQFIPFFLFTCCLRPKEEEFNFVSETTREGFNFNYLALEVLCVCVCMCE